MSCDFRHLFDHKVIEQPKTWGEAECARSLGPKQRFALKTLSEQGIWHLSRRDKPTNRIFPRLRDRCELIVHFAEEVDSINWTEEEYYYVVTNGGRRAEGIYRISTPMMQRIFECSEGTKTF